jgi:adenosylmethionine-8-amino-7-oxononanoate aminotransferase
MHDRLQVLAAERLLMHFTNPAPYVNGDGELLVIDRGEGVHVYDTRGRRYLDGLSSLYCASLGYSYGREFAETASAQLSRLGFWTNWNAAHPAAIELAEALTDIAPAGLTRAFFTSGGSEAVEAAWKLTRQYHQLNGEPQRTKAIARRTAYHGVTLGALSFTGLEAMKAPFEPHPVPVRRISNTNRFRSPHGTDAALTAHLLAELEQAILEEGPETVAMIIAEPVQNAGGSITPPAGYWPGLREIADRHGILLVADEVITGFGRTGEMFGSDRVGGRPDLITLAKALTAGQAPMGAVLVAEHVAAPFIASSQPFLHGITFGGHPLCAAIAGHALAVFERDDVVGNVQGLQDHFERRMRELGDQPTVGDVRGCGFFWTAELVKAKPDAEFSADERRRLVGELLPAAFRRAGLIARADDRGFPVVQVAPPLICGRDDIDELVDLVEACIAEAMRGLVEA